MATKTIGTGGDYSTAQAWEDALPATLTEAEVGQLKNESHSDNLTISGITTSATYTLTLECVTGGSFRDHANAATNALYPNASYGAIITNSSNYDNCITISSVNYCTIRNIQILKSGAPSAGIAAASADNNTIESCLIQSKPTSSVIRINGASSLIQNCCAINAGTGGYGIEADSGSTPIKNCTVVRPTVNSSASTGIKGTYATPVVTNCAVFGFSTSLSGANASSDYNASDTTISVGSNNQASKTYANQFVDTGGTLANSDFRLKTGADCIDTGTSSGMPSVDIVNQSRASYDIGCWEFQAPATGTSYIVGGGVGGASSVIGA